jgi:hypothetical protein
MTCTGQGARNTPPPLWPTPVHVRTGASRLPADKAQERVCVQHAAPSPICEKGTGMGRHVGDMVPPSECPPPLPFVPALPPLRATQHANGGGTEGGEGGHAKEDCMHPPPLAVWPPPVRTPIGTPSSPSAHGVCATPALCTNGECRAACKGASHSPFRPSPLAPTQSNRTGQVQDPRTQTGHRNASVLHHPRFLRPTHTSRAHEQGWLPLSHPHPHVHAEKAQGWTAMWETVPPTPAVPSLPDERGAETAPPPFPPPSRLVCAKQGTLQMRGTTRALCRAPPSLVCLVQSGMSGVGVTGRRARTGMDRERCASRGDVCPLVLHPHCNASLSIVRLG